MYKPSQGRLGASRAAHYGGKRVRLGLPEPLKDGATKQRSLKPISKQDGVKLAFLLTLGPYLAERTEKLYQNLSFPSEGNLARNGREDHQTNTLNSMEWGASHGCTDQVFT